MPPINVMIKPASDRCNLRCSYCFYKDVAENRETACFGQMSEETLEAVVRQIFAYAEGQCTISWQGGEPTLAGLDFFKRYMELEKKYNIADLPVTRAIQTNGTLIDDDWAEFFAQNHFLVGISLDGVRSSHDRFRRSASEDGTFSAVLSAVRCLARHKVDFNVLTVVNQITCKKAHLIYPFFQEQGFRYQQYIACLDPLGEPAGQRPWSLTPEDYGAFLISLFQQWYQDCLRGRAPYIRQFENYIGLLAGIQPESCEQRGVCAVQTVVEADGSVYPCDFFVLDEFRLGNLNQDTIAQCRSQANAKHFFERSLQLPERCSSCKYLHLCRGGCYRHRMTEDGVNYFCKGYQMFFDRCLPQLQELARKIM